MIIEFTLPIEPVAKGRPRFSRQGHAYTPKVTRTFEKTVWMMSSQYRPRNPFVGPIELSCRFIVAAPKRKVREQPYVKPDLDNLLKALTDGLKGFWVDDAQIVKMSAVKIYDWVGKPRIEVRINRSE